MQHTFEHIAQQIKNSRSVFAFTGAGVSTESGIPDFRSPGGVWATSQPVYFDEYLQSPEARVEYWRQKSLTHQEFTKALPNATHTILAEWEEAGIIQGVITQNIDGLHHIAGTRSILELHGTAREISCLDCHWRAGADALVDEFERTGQVPNCPQCGGLTKHATISFGQALPANVLREAMSWARKADCFLALGSSLVVHPAAGLPSLAKESGAQLIIINRDETPLDYLADMVIHASLGETMTRINDRLKSMNDSAGTGSG